MSVAQTAIETLPGKRRVHMGCIARKQHAAFAKFVCITGVEGIDHRTFDLTPVVRGIRCYQFPDRLVAREHVRVFILHQKELPAAASF